MAFDTSNLAKAAFKKLFGKAHTGPPVGEGGTKDLPNESVASQTTVASSGVYGEAIPLTPPASSTTVIRVCTSGQEGELDLTEDGSSNGNTYFVTVPVGHDLLSFTNSETGVNYVAGDRVKNIIPASFGSGYRPIPKDNGTEIPPTDASDWFLDDKAGTLTSETDLNLSTTGTIACYVYVGDMVSDVLTTQSDHGNLSGLTDDDHTQYILADGTRALTGNWDAGSFRITAETFTSDVVTGTAPFIVSSTTEVANLHAATATQWATTRTIDMSGDVSSDAVNIDGSGNVTITNTVVANDSHTHSIYLNKDGSVALTANWDAGSFKITAETFESDIVTGTSPFIVASTTVVTNLNADLLDGIHTGTSGNTIGLLDGINTWSAVQTFSANPRINDNIELEFGNSLDSQISWISVQENFQFKINTEGGDFIFSTFPTSTDGVNSGIYTFTTGGAGGIGSNSGSFSFSTGTSTGTGSADSGDIAFSTGASTNAASGDIAFTVGTGSTNGNIDFTIDGSNLLHMTSTIIVLNESSDDVDIRIESATNANMLRFDAAGEFISIGASTDLGGMFNIIGQSDEPSLIVRGASGLTANLFVIENSAGTDLLVMEADGDMVFTGSQKFFFRDSAIFIHSNADGEMTIEADTKVTIGVAGDIVLGDSTERNMYPQTTLKMNLGTAANTFNDAYIGGVMVFGAQSELTIATGAITQTKAYHTVDTEANAATDDLDTINGGVEGSVLVIRPNIATRTVVAKDGTGNLQLAGDFTMDNSEDTLILIYDGANWLELSRSGNGA